MGSIIGVFIGIGLILSSIVGFGYIIFLLDWSTQTLNFLSLEMILLISLFLVGIFVLISNLLSD